MTGVWISPATLERLAAVLLHFVWQGAAIALLTAFVLRLLRGRPPEWRYATASLSLVAMLLAPFATFAFHDAIGVLTRRLLLVPGDAAARMMATASVDDVAIWTRRIVVVWIAGVGILLMRLVGGWLLSRRLVRSAAEVTTPVIAGILQRARVALDFSGAVRVMSGAHIEAPMVIGWLRPAILLPASALTGLTPEQLLSIVAHELAHVRRHDFLVNGLQRVVECVLFYHPAVWWVSGRIRLERERCCDDLAVRVCGDRLVYAQALEAIERERTSLPALAVATTGSGVTERVRRILGVPGTRDWQSAAAAVVFAVILVSAGTWQPPMLARSPEPLTAATPTAAQRPAPAERPAAPARTAPIGALLTIAAGTGDQRGQDSRVPAPQAAPSSPVSEPSIAASRIAAREKLGLLRVDYSADSFVKQAAEGDTIAVQTFLAAGMHINARDQAGYTAALKAAEAGQVETLQSLLAAGADPNLSGGKNDASPLSAAAARGDVAMMKVLLAAGAEVDRRIGVGTAANETALIVAATNGHRDAVALLLDQKASLDAQSVTGTTALIAAASGGHVDLARLLLDRGADVNAQTEPPGAVSALHLAARRGNLRLMQLLLDRGANVNLKADGDSPLHRLIGRDLSTPPSGAPAAAELLIERGADVNATSKTGETALPMAVNKLLSLPLSSSSLPPSLSRSVEEVREIAMLLIERGADVNARQKDGTTALNRAIVAKQEGIVRAMLAKGADPNLANTNGATPLSTASGYKLEAIEKLLIEAGAKR